MGLTPTLSAVTVPLGTQFPGDPQSFLNFIAANMQVNGLATFNGINFGASTPAPSGRSLPWFKTDNSGNPIGFSSWNGSIWTPSPISPQSGTFASAPTGTSPGQLYYATDLGTAGVLCSWSGSAWVTADGVSGDIKPVRGTNLATILANNPGWLQLIDMAACVVGVAGNGTAHSFSTRAADSGYPIGEENHLLTLPEVPAHAHTYTTFGNLAGTSGANPIFANQTTTNTGSAGGGLTHNNMQPTWFVYWLQKS
jgi:hypothetical protein